MYHRFETNKAVIRIEASSNTGLHEVEKIIDELGLSGNEARDRLLIQKAMDDGKIAGKVLYNSNIVFSSKKLLKEFKKMEKTDSITNMSDEMYQFLISHFDIAHYDKHGYIVEYDGSYKKMISSIMAAFNYIPDRFSDIKNIISQQFNL